MGSRFHTVIQADGFFLTAKRFFSMPSRATLQSCLTLSSVTRRRNLLTWHHHFSVTEPGVCQSPSLRPLAGRTVLRDIQDRYGHGQQVHVSDEQNVLNVWKHLSTRWQQDAARRLWGNKTGRPQCREFVSLYRRSSFLVQPSLATGLNHSRLYWRLQSQEVL